MTNSAVMSLSLYFSVEKRGTCIARDFKWDQFHSQSFIGHKIVVDYNI